jgi:hypothetical protein
MLMAGSIEDAAELFSIARYLLECIEIPFTETANTLTVINGGTMHFEAHTEIQGVIYNHIVINECDGA